jgi:hypothetical protein
LLESVKFIKDKQTFNDVILTVTSMGVTLKSADICGDMMSRTLIKPQFFASFSFRGKQEVKFLLPFATLRSLMQLM